MQPIGYFIIVILILILILLYTNSTTKVKTTTTPTEKKIVQTVVSNPIVSPSNVESATDFAQIVHNPDQPDYHPSDGNINTGSAPSGSINIPNEFAYDYDPKYRCDMGILLGDKCSIEMYPMQPTDMNMGLTKEQANANVNKNNSGMDTIIKKIGRSGVKDAVFTYNVEYYDKKCMPGYKRVTDFDTISKTPVYWCASDRIPQHTVPSIPYCDDGFILNGARCVADITTLENGI